MFPFAGCELEVLSYDGVRYTGELHCVDSANRVITLIKVHHHGTEGRCVSGHDPKPGKGRLPEAEQRVIYAEYISQLRRIEKKRKGDRSDRTGGEGQRATNAPVAHPAVGEALHVQVNEQPECSSVDRRLNDKRTEPDSLLDGDTDISDGEVVSPEPMGDLLQEVRLRLRNSSPAAYSASQSSSSRSEEDYPYPVYFISQLQLKRAVGILINSESNRHSPVYLAFDYDRFAADQPPVISQLWRVDDYEWETRQANRQLSNHQHCRMGRSREGVHEFIRRTGEVPWMSDFLIHCQAKAAGAIKLVREAEPVRRPGRITCIKQANSDMLLAEVDAVGAVPGVRLSENQYEGGRSFNRLAAGDKVELEMVRLPQGFYVGPKFVLPNIKYGSGRGPYRPSLHPYHRTTRSADGNCYPVKIIG